MLFHAANALPCRPCFFSRISGVGEWRGMEMPYFPVGRLVLWSPLAAGRVVFFVPTHLDV